MRPQLADGFAWKERKGAPALVCQPLSETASHFFTTRSWALGSRNPAAGLADAWGEVAAELRVSADRLVRLRQVHGAAVVVRRQGEPLDLLDLPAADIVMTDDPTIGLAVQTADCVPLLMSDLRSGVVAAVHAGWRGLAAGAPAIAVRALSNHFGTRADDIVAALGPSICAECYEVGEEVRATFLDGGFDREAGSWFPVETRPGHWRFDGWQSARDQLVAAGVAASKIHGSGFCTFTHEEWCCSYRRDGNRAGRMGAAIRMKN